MQRKLSLVPILLGLAEARQTTVSDKTLQLYATKLAELPIDDVKAAVNQLAGEPRRDGDPAFPSLGSIKSRVLEVRVERRRARHTQVTLSQYERDFWDWVDSRLQDPDTVGMTEQQFLDTINRPGYTGRKARNPGLHIVA